MKQQSEHLGYWNRVLWGGPREGLGPRVPAFPKEATVTCIHPSSVFLRCLPPQCSVRVHSLLPTDFGALTAVP